MRPKALRLRCTEAWPRRSGPHTAFPRPWCFVLVSRLGPSMREKWQKAFELRISKRVLGKCAPFWGDSQSNFVPRFFSRFSLTPVLVVVHSGCNLRLMAVSLPGLCLDSRGVKMNAMLRGFFAAISCTALLLGSAFATPADPAGQSLN